MTDTLVFMTDLDNPRLETYIPNKDGTLNKTQNFRIDTLHRNNKERGKDATTMALNDAESRIL